MKKETGRRQTNVSVFCILSFSLASFVAKVIMFDKYMFGDQVGDGSVLSWQYLPGKARTVPACLCCLPVVNKKTALRCDD